MTILIILWLLQIVFLNEFYKRIKIQEIKELGTSIVQNFENNDIQSLVEEVSNLKDVDIEIISPNNEVLILSKSLNERMMKTISLSEREFIMNELRKDNVKEVELERMPFHSVAARSGSHHYGTVPMNYTMRVATDGQALKTISRMSPVISGQTTRIIPISNVTLSHVEEDRRGLVYATTFVTGAGNENILLISSMITPIEATVSTLRAQLGIITIITIIFSIILSLIISRRVATPIERLNKSAGRLAKGELDINFTGTGYKEISELSNTLNYATKELSKVDNLRKELIGNISHDLRTPLTLIGGYAEMMRDLPGENTKENAAVIVDETTRLTRLVNDLLEFSKAQAGAQEFKLEKYNLTESLNSVVKNLNELIKKDGYRITLKSEGEVYVESDEIKINQVFYNFISNAINYTGENKLVDISIEEKGEMVYVKVIDYGEGIEAEYLPYVWDRYYKIDKVHKRAIVGTGIGLSIVKAILERCPNACYGVDSEVGKGTTFYFGLKKCAESCN